MRIRTVSTIVTVTLITAVTAAVSIWIIDKAQCTWDSWRPATCQSQESNCFCEHINTSGAKQPINTATGFGFVWVGILVAIREWQVRKLRIERSNGPQLFRVCFGLAYPMFLIIVGLGTAFYHASLTFVGQSFDIGGMYLIVLLFLAYGLARLQNWRTAQAVALFGTACIFFLSWATIYPGARRYIFAAMVVSILVCEYAYHSFRQAKLRYSLLLAAVIVLAGGHIFWQLDYHGVFCDPSGWYQGHALWHVLGSVSAYLAYRFYRSELEIET
ncbi:MAG: ceramidase domain-containing protein [bacterium]|nr:ceramidase domain-containing protein [bacterium]